MYSVSVISKLLRVNPETVRRWIKCGKLEAFQQKQVANASGQLMFVVKEEDFEEFLNMNAKYKKRMDKADVPLSSDERRSIQEILNKIEILLQEAESILKG